MFSKTQDESRGSMPTTSNTANSLDNYTQMHELEVPNFPAELEPTEPSGNVLLAADASPAVKLDTMNTKQLSSSEQPAVVEVARFLCIGSLQIVSVFICFDIFVLGVFICLLGFQYFYCL